MVPTTYHHHESNPFAVAAAVVSGRSPEALVKDD